MQQNAEIKGFRVAVTGGAFGLGLALARLLCKKGARVTFVARFPPGRRANLLRESARGLTSLARFDKRVLIANIF